VLMGTVLLRMLQPVLQLAVETATDVNPACQGRVLALPRLLQPVLQLAVATATDVMAGPCAGPAAATAVRAFLAFISLRGFYPVKAGVLGGCSRGAVASGCWRAGVFGRGWCRWGLKHG
jgi:hypothetical protein